MFPVTQWKEKKVNCIETLPKKREDKLSKEAGAVFLVLRTRAVSQVCLRKML